MVQGAKHFVDWGYGIHGHNLRGKIASVLSRFGCNIPTNPPEKGQKAEGTT